MGTDEDLIEKADASTLTSDLIERKDFESQVDFTLTEINEMKDKHE